MATNSRKKADDGEGMAVLLGFGLLFLAARGLYSLFGNRQPSIEQNQLSQMEQEIARMYAEEDYEV